MGRRRVSVMRSAGGLCGLDEGVCTEHTLTNVAMKTTRPTLISRAPHQ